MINWSFWVIRIACDDVRSVTRILAHVLFTLENSVERDDYRNVAYHDQQPEEDKWQ
jgi:hypothetical protein